MSKQSRAGAARQKQPTIELYMYSLNQEFPSGKGHHSFLKRHSEVLPDVALGLVHRDSIESQVFLIEKAGATDWGAQWVSNEWITNHTKVAGVGLHEQSDPLTRAVIREEEFGAIIFEPISDRVYRLNPEGRDLFRELRAAYLKGKRDLRAFRSRKFADKDVAEFVSFLEGAGLWIRR